MNRDKKCSHPPYALAGVLLAGWLGGCELLVDFDRSRIPKPETSSTGDSMEPGSTGGSSATNATGGSSVEVDAGDASLDSDAGADGAVSTSNRAPLAANDSYTTSLSWVLSVTAATGLLVNDSDPDQDALTITMVSKPDIGQLTWKSNGSFIYTDNGELTLAVGESRVVTFTYQASDGTLTSAPATVSITITRESTDASMPIDGSTLPDGSVPDAG